MTKAGNVLVKIEKAKKLLEQKKCEIDAKIAKLGQNDSIKDTLLDSSRLLFELQDKKLEIIRKKFVLSKAVLSIENPGRLKKISRNFVKLTDKIVNQTKELANDLLLFE